MTADRCTHLPSPLGRLVLYARGEVVVRLAFAVGHGRAIPSAPERIVPADGDPALDPVARALDAYFGGAPLPADLPLSLSGTPFQRRVWEAMARIPHGATTTYGRVASDLGVHPRPLGAAVGANPLPVLVPCHRLLGAGGALTGYVGGLDRKRWLLRHEAGARQERLFR